MHTVRASELIMRFVVRRLDDVLVLEDGSHPLKHDFGFHPHFEVDQASDLDSALAGAECSLPEQDRYYFRIAHPTDTAKDGQLKKLDAQLWIQVHCFLALACC